MFHLGLNEEDIKKSVIISDNILLQNPDYLCLVGSKLYGTNTNNSDTDIRGFIFLPPEYVLGYKKFGQHESIYSDIDIVVWSVNKLVNMLLSGSSVAIEMMFCPDTYTIRESELAKEIKRNRTFFMSKKCIKNYLGYAEHEWRKVKGEITRELGNKRKEDILKYGYSVKNAYHAIRILQQAESLESYNFIGFPCQSREFLKAIKFGDVSFEEAEQVYLSTLRRVELGLETTYLPEIPAYEKINKLLCQMNLRNILSSLVPPNTYKLPFYQHQVGEEIKDGF